MQSAFRFRTGDRVTILTGSGISAESGIMTFRDKGGLWERHRFEDVATAEAFRMDPAMVWRFYKYRFDNAVNSDPNTAHHALKKLEDYLDCGFHLITQNVDGLHQRAGSRSVLEMHGSLHRAFCSGCRSQQATAELDFSDPVPKCPRCGGLMRPDIVWFGEMPYKMDEIQGILAASDYLIVIGTSGVVYPAAQFLIMAKQFGARTIGVNLERPQNAMFFDEFHQGKAGEILPELVEVWERPCPDLFSV